MGVWYVHAGFVGTAADKNMARSWPRCFRRDRCCRQRRERQKWQTGHDVRIQRSQGRSTHRDALPGPSTAPLAEMEGGIDRFLQVRVDENGSTVQLQAARVLLQRKRQDGTTQHLSLFSLVHVAEPIYYRLIRQEIEHSDRVYCELIARTRSIRFKSETLRLSTEPLFPTLQARQLAAQYGLVCQLDELDPYALGFFVADMTHEELAASLGASWQQEFRDRSRLMEAIQACWRPRWEPSPSVWSRGARALLWLLPGPELPLILFDWILQGGQPAPILTALLDAFTRFDLLAVRRLVFAQLLVSEQKRAGLRKDLLVRNTRAIRVVSADQSSERVALLYGAMHMPDLVQRLVSEEGFRVVECSWDSVWSVMSRSELNLGTARFLAFAVPAYLSLDALDWAELVQWIASGNVEEASIFTALYLLRHAVLYIFIANWALDWSKRLFD
ncbi:hypothetical protein FVE85_5632 [Porphyridium purpureum]|uniref:Uncharacterized protein n=1 Tax=Porphyridium purpureum TaxID=35688 RepID=A0A5J4Z5X6_PORPP|nr:hypothetical protein FVE85_5632 [Porphyridium purpureum]|eukprot:POR7155..scf295_1